MASPAFEQRLLVLLLRLVGGVTCLAFLAMLMPTDWMAATHQWLGLGEFPRTPIVDYLTRSIAALYGTVAVLMLVVAQDPVRYRPLVRWLGALHVLFGALLVPIDLHAGLPAYWTLTEGPPIAMFGVVVLYLCRAPAPARAREAV